MWFLGLLAGMVVGGTVFLVPQAASTAAASPIRAKR